MRARLRLPNEIDDEAAGAIASIEAMRDDKAPGAVTREAEPPRRAG